MDPTDSLLDYVEGMIGKNENFQLVLKMLCLLSLTQNGIKAKQFDFIRKELLQTYGFDKILTIANLEKAGLLKK
jgi:hypothetical protein